MSKLAIPIRLTRAAMRLVAMFGRAAWDYALNARDAPDAVPRVSKHRAVEGRPCWRFNINRGSAPVRKVERWLARGGGSPLLRSEQEIAADHIHPRHKRFGL